jgi:hypothetical protein
MHDDINSGGGYFMHHVIPFTVVSETDQNRQVDPFTQVVSRNQNMFLGFT